jgi:outer membrane protein, adhesin transport system
LKPPYVHISRFSLFLMLCSCAPSWGASLDDLIRQGLLSYPSVLSRQSSRDAAKTDLTAAKLRFLPNASFNTQRNQVAYSGQPVSNQPATNITISQPLFLDGGIIAGYNKADAKLNAADFALLETREDISKRIINAYTEWVKAWFKIQALEANVRLHEKLAGMISRRFDQGVASGADKDLGISRLHQAQAELDTQRSLESTALTSLSELVGEPINRRDLVGNIAKHVTIPRRPDGIAKAQAQSVTVQRYKFEAEAAEHEAKEIRAQALPQVSLQAQRQVGNAILPGAQGYDLYGLVINYAPGGGFASVATASAAFERAKSATLQVDTAKRELTDRLNADYNEYEFALLKKESLQRSVNLTADIAASYDRQFLVGRKSWLDLMNSVREQAQTKVQLADAEGSLLGASRRLMVYIDGTMPFDSPPEHALNKK